MPRENTLGGGDESDGAREIRAVKQVSLGYRRLVIAKPLLFGDACTPSASAIALSVGAAL
jgi:hypothetical protein